MANNETAAAPVAAKSGKAKRVEAPIHLPKACATLVTQATSTAVTGRGKYTVMADALWAAGYTPKLIHRKTGPEKYKHVREELKAAIIAGMPAEARRLIGSDPKSLTDAEKILRKTAQQDTGAYYSKVEAHLRRREEAAKGGAKKKRDTDSVRSPNIKKAKSAEQLHEVIASTMAAIRASDLAGDVKDALCKELVPVAERLQALVPVKAKPKAKAKKK